MRDGGRGVDGPGGCIGRREMNGAGCRHRARGSNSLLLPDQIRSNDLAFKRERVSGSVVQAAIDAAAVDVGAVAALEVFEKEVAVLLHDASVLPADGQRFEEDAHVRLSANGRGLPVEREALSLIRPLDGKE